MPSEAPETEEPDVDPDDGLALLREESRYVVDAQLSTLRETDRKAMATARVDAVIVGLLLSAASLADSPASVVTSGS
jgi:hypothetical protein